jgi:hypothetical protein
VASRPGLPDTHKMMQLAGVSLHTPSKKQMGRFIDRAKDRLVVTMPLGPVAPHQGSQASGTQNNNLRA